MTAEWKKIAKILKDEIDNYGKRYLISSPFKVYKKLLGQAVDMALARAVLMTLLADIPVMADQDADKELLGGTIQKECFFTKKTADALAELYSDLYGEENQKAWAALDLQGFQQFCDTNWGYSWEGDARWSPRKNRSIFVECTFELSFDFEVEDENKAKSALSGVLAANPFLSAVALRKAGGGTG